MELFASKPRAVRTAALSSPPNIRMMARREIRRGGKDKVDPPKDDGYELSTQSD